jgi:hypothetical protein
MLLFAFPLAFQQPNATLGAHPLSRQCQSSPCSVRPFIGHTSKTQCPDDDGQNAPSQKFSGLRTYTTRGLTLLTILPRQDLCAMCMWGQWERLTHTCVRRPANAIAAKLSMALVPSSLLLFLLASSPVWVALSLPLPVAAAHGGQAGGQHCSPFLFFERRGKRIATSKLY